MIPYLFLFFVFFAGVLHSCQEAKGRSSVIHEKNFALTAEDTIPFILYIDSQYVYLDNGQKVHIAGLSDPRQQVLFVIRHAEEDSIGLDPGLSDKGNARAARLVTLLRNASIKNLYSILFRRTALTVRPLVKAYDLSISHYDPDQVEYLTDYRIPENPENTLIVGTTRSVAILLNLLTQSDDYSPLPKTIYDRMYIVLPAEHENDTVRVFSYRY